MNCPRLWPLLNPRNPTSKTFPVATGRYDGREDVLLQLFIPCCLWLCSGAMRGACPSAQARAHVQQFCGLLCPRPRGFVRPNVPAFSFTYCFSWLYHTKLEMDRGTISEETQEGCCELFPVLRNRKMIHVSRSHQKLPVMQFALASSLWP